MGLAGAGPCSSFRRQNLTILGTRGDPFPISTVPCARHKVRALGRMNVALHEKKMQANNGSTKNFSGTARILDCS